MAGLGEGRPQPHSSLQHTLKQQSGSPPNPVRIEGAHDLEESMLPPYPITISPSNPRPSVVCPRCHGTSMRLGPGSGPHYARLLCATCGRFVRWLSRPGGGRP